MFSIKLEQICFSLNNNCNHNCNDCYVECKRSNTESVSINEIECFLKFVTDNNISKNKHISIDFMGGEMSEYPSLSELAKLIKKYTKDYIIDDIRVTTYADKSDNLINFIKDMIDVVNHVRYFIIRDLTNGLDAKTVDYVNLVSTINDKVKPVVEHVLRPKDIPSYKNLLRLAYQHKYISLDICYPCGVTDFQKCDLDNLTRIYNDFICKCDIKEDIDFTTRVSMFDINHNSIHDIMSRIKNQEYTKSKCKPFTSELWLSPRGNIFPCAHMIKYDDLFDYNNVAHINQSYFKNELTNKFILDKNDEMCYHCVAKSFCLQCKILPEILDMDKLSNINRVQDKCDRVLNHIKSVLENIHE